jgi:hypothetical protein
MSGLSTYSVSALAAGAAAAARSAPRHLRVARQASTSAAVITVTGIRSPRVGSRSSNSGNRLSPARIRGSTAESSQPGLSRPAKCAPRPAVTATQAASSARTGQRSGPGNSPGADSGPGIRRATPRHITPWYAGGRGQGAYGTRAGRGMKRLADPRVDVRCDPQP